jgi:hypothetical protein
MLMTPPRFAGKRLKGPANPTLRVPTGQSGILPKCRAITLNLIRRHGGSLRERMAAEIADGLCN